MSGMECVLVQNERMTDSTVIDANPQIFIKERKGQDLQVRDWRKVIQAIAGGVVKCINATFWAV
jgi:hypothetical protein